MNWKTPKYKFLFLPHKCYGCQEWFWLVWVMCDNHGGLGCPNEKDEHKVLAGWHKII